VRTRVGYAGGEKENPTYRSLGNHTETIQIEYDPDRVSYAELLDIFWHSHDPAQRPYSQQYKSIIFYHDEEQKRLALETREREADRRGKNIFTEIVPASRFYLAEDYHQKYYLQQTADLMREFQRMYPAGGWIDSTAAARVNGYLGRNNTARLPQEIQRLGLSSEAEQKLLDRAGVRE
jgi:methionine-S-sulfoxide reductase